GLEAEREIEASLVAGAVALIGDSDDGDGVSVEGDGAAENRGIGGDAGSPIPNAEHGGGRLSAAFFIGGEAAPERGLQTGGGQVIRGHEARLDALGFAAADGAEDEMVAAG